jgi:sialate O-acetylesterase
MSHTRKMTATLVAFAVSASACPGNPRRPGLLNPILADHVVLQRDRPIEVWGKAQPFDEVTVTLASSESTARADANGDWKATLKPMPAGGPYVLVARTRSGQTQGVVDVQVGDVWLCSGQSNMEITVARALNPRTEIWNSANNLLRALTVSYDSSPTPKDVFAAPLEWKVASPKTTGSFSAACYYFARTLQSIDNVPMGLVVSAWGGSKILAWLSASGIRALGNNDALLGVLDEYTRDPAAAAAKFGLIWQDWWRSRVTEPARREPWSPASAPDFWRAAPRELGFWENWGVPELAAYNGIVLYRTRITLTAQQARAAATLSIGMIDEVDVTWVNGRFVGTSSSGDRRYPLPLGALKEGENLIVVADLDTYELGGITGPAEKRALLLGDGTSVPLSGAWEYLVAPKSIGNPPRVPWEPLAGLTTIYNAMIAPLGTFGFRGALWYQGEGNGSLDEAPLYQAQLTALMADWRTRFGADLPFLIAQLANYGEVPVAPVESGWAQVREGQRRAVEADPHAGLAVAIDIGEPYEIHPANKQELGRRLAMEARRVIYGEPLARGSGPWPLAARREGSKVVVTFRSVDRGLISRSGKAPTAFELCPAEADACRFVDATLRGDGVVLDASDPGFAATRVRYCWADAPICTLTDRSGLPAVPFEIAIK